MRRTILMMAVLLAWGCGKDEGVADPDSGCGANARCAADVETSPNIENPDMAGGTDVADPGDMGNVPLPDTSEGDDMASTPDMPTTCGRMPALANRARKVVVAHPFTDSQYEVFDLDQQGNLTQPGVTFDMGAGHEGEIQFTPDGEVGYSVQDGGTLGVFRFADDGSPEVLVAQHDPGFYVSGALIDATGDNLYAWETGFRKTDDGMANGAMYRIPLDCASGMPGEAEEFFRGKLIRGAAWATDELMAVGADDLLDIEMPNDGHLIDIAGPTRLASGQAFSDMDSILAGFDVTRDANYMLIGDNSAFAAEPNALAVLAIGDSELTLVQTIEMDDPVRIITSPFDNAAIVLNTMDDTINVLSYDPGAAQTPFTLEGPLDTTEPTLLPLGAAMIRRGDLEGLVIVGENVSVRRVRFNANGSVESLGALALGDSAEAITGSVGVQP